MAAIVNEFDRFKDEAFDGIGGRVGRSLQGAINEILYVDAARVGGWRENASLTWETPLDVKATSPPGTLTEEMMIGSAFVAARYLQSQLLNCQKGKPKRVHVIGTAGLCNEVKSAGTCVSGDPCPIATPSGMSRDELAGYNFLEEEIDAVLVGLDNDFNYRKLCIATVLLQRNPDALLVATNRDAFDLVRYDARHLS